MGHPSLFLVSTRSDRIALGGTGDVGHRRGSVSALVGLGEVDRHPIAAPTERECVGHPAATNGFVLGTTHSRTVAESPL
jgi:hypothetical protein